MTLCILEKEFPPLFVQRNDTFDVSPSGGVGSLWSCAHQMDALVEIMRPDQQKINKKWWSWLLLRTR